MSRFDDLMSALGQLLLFCPPLLFVFFVLHIYRKQRSGHAGI